MIEKVLSQWLYYCYKNKQEVNHLNNGIYTTVEWVGIKYEYKLYHKQWKRNTYRRLLTKCKQTTHRELRTGAQSMMRSRQQPRPTAVSLRDGLVQLSALSKQNVLVLRGPDPKLKRVMIA